MNITILTLFPDMFSGFATNSIMKRAIGKGVATINVVNIRDYTKDKYGRTDTPPIGGGAGLIEKCQPIVDALKANRKEDSHVILMSPRGHTYDLISIGDYVLTGGEIPAMAIADSVIRLLDGAITKDSLTDESFNADLLEYPQYTEPYEFEGQKVPDILYCGNHQAIEKWRRKQSLLLTKKHRPDLFAKVPLSKQDKKLLAECDEEETPNWEKQALAKGKKFMKH